MHFSTILPLLLTGLAVQGTPVPQSFDPFDFSGFATGLNAIVAGSLANAFANAGLGAGFGTGVTTTGASGAAPTGTFTTGGFGDFDTGSFLAELESLIGRYLNGTVTDLFPTTTSAGSSATTTAAMMSS